MTSSASNCSPKEIRKSPRVVFRRAAIVHMDQTRKVAAKTLDLSIEGLCLLTNTSMHPGTACYVEFNASFTHEPLLLKLNARAAYCVLAGQDGFRIGFHFPELDSQTQKHLQNLVNTRDF